MLRPVKGEVISDCRENADPVECSPARFVTTATDARIIMQTSAPNENHMKVKTLNSHTLTHKTVYYSSSPFQSSSLLDNHHNLLFHLLSITGGLYFLLILSNMIFCAEPDVSFVSGSENTDTFSRNTVMIV